MTTSRHTHTRRLRRGPIFALLMLVLAGFCVADAAGAATSADGGYGWPVKPFHSQHPVRGFFGDPRETGHHGSRSFHLGVDVSAPDGTPVYATMSGRIYVEGERPETVAIRSDDGRSAFAYWHIVPVVSTGMRATAYRTLLGHIAKGWGHVHFAERHDNVYLNPLRPGAMGPYGDRTQPTISSVRVQRSDAGVASHGRGSLDVVADIFDTTPLAVPAPWNGKPVMPALVRWRIVRRDGTAALRWRTVLDYRRTIPPARRFSRVYASSTRQNRPRCRGRYRVLLLSARDSGTLPNGRFKIEVAASDTRGNRAVARFAIQIANHVARVVRAGEGD